MVSFAVGDSLGFYPIMALFVLYVALAMPLYSISVAYTNDHLTRKLAGELRGLLDLADELDLAMSAEAVYEDIDSQGYFIIFWITFHVKRLYFCRISMNHYRLIIFTRYHCFISSTEIITPLKFNSIIM